MDTDYILQIFWHEKFWLPVGTSWTNLESHEKNVYYPKARDMSLAVLVAVVFLAFRYCYERTMMNNNNEWNNDNNERKRFKLFSIVLDTRKQTQSCDNPFGTVPH
uniref:Uncharacterized protein n=1 Tax=Octopus bimaculoides TaxID=37653 RepID=A0A0L8HI75_OCTBM